MKANFIQQTDIKYKKYLAKLHSQFSIPTELLNKSVVEATGSHPDEVKRIVNGESNEIYDVRNKDGVETIVKISRRGHDFKKEEWIGEQCKKKGLPVAKIIYTNKYQSGKETLHVSLQEKLEGVPFNRLLIDDFENRSRLETVVIRLGEMVSKVHQVETTGFDLIDGQGRGIRKSWSEFMLLPLERREKLYAVACELDIGTMTIGVALKLLTSYKELYEMVEPRLLYGDFDPRNVLIKDNQITGLIDFEDSLSGDPVWDFARWDYFHEFHGFPTTLLMQGYEDKDLFRNNFMTKFHLYRLRLGMNFLEYFAMKKNKVGLKVTQNNLAEDLSYFHKIKVS